MNNYHSTTPQLFSS